MSLPVRVAAILVLILAATVGLTTVLAANKYRQGLGEILDARYRLAVSDIVATIDTSLDLGVLRAAEVTDRPVRSRPDDVLSVPCTAVTEPWMSRTNSAGSALGGSSFRKVTLQLALLTTISASIRDPSAKVTPVARPCA